MTMSLNRQQQLLTTQTSIARKVFDLVPIQDAWPVSDIYGALRAANTAADARTVRRCLGELKDQGLIRETSTGVFQRNPATVKQKSEPVMPQSTVATVVAIKKSDAGALDALGALSAEVVTLAEEISSRLKKMAGRIEEVALSVAAEQESNAEALSKLKQLQDLLKGIAQ